MISRAYGFNRTAVITVRSQEFDNGKKQIVMSRGDSQRKLNAKGAAFAPHCGAINPPAMFTDDLLGICETEAGAIALRGEEWDEKISSFFLGHATTVIADRYQGPRTIPLGADRQVSSIGHRIQCITDQ